VQATKDQIAQWLVEHEAYVRANSGKPPPKPAPPPEPPPSPSSYDFGRFIDSPNLSKAFGPSSIAGRFGLPSHAAPEDSKKFEDRVATYMAQWRKGFVNNLLAKVVQSGRNKVKVVARNGTADPIQDVRVRAFIPGRNLIVFTGPPKTTPLPDRMPRWPNYVDDMLNRPGGYQARELLRAELVTAEAVRVDGGFEVTWDLGDIRPHDRSEPRTFTIIASPATPEQIEIRLTAMAMNRRGNATSSSTIAVDSEVWTPWDWFDATPS
jgi:hypothetical protein